LTADIAVEFGLASAEEVAELLARYWRDRDASVLSGLKPEDRARVEGEVESVISASEGDARRALAGRGVGRDLSASLQPKAAHELSEAGATIRAPLRALDKKRYVGFLPLGQGGMGVVYLALDSELNRRVAFKMIRSGMTDPMGADSGPVSDDMIARFLQEAIVTGGLEHPGIVPVYELGLTPSGVPYYTMRLVRGERTLDDAISDAKSLEDRLALLEPFLKVCDAVGYAHARGVVHRDLKPANIAIGQFGEVVVLDWGLAKMRTRPELEGSRWQSRLDEIRETTDFKTLTSAVGTPGYMAPEAALAEVDSIDERSDVYSLGAILYRLLTGDFPFKFTSFSDYIGQVTKGIEDVPGAPEGLSRIVVQALAARRDARYHSVGELAEAVRAWQRESAVDREIDALQNEAEAALASAADLHGDALLRQLDRVMAVAARILHMRPEHERALALRTEARESRAQAIAAGERDARRRLMRRVGVVGLLAATAATIVVAVLVNTKRREAEEARQRAETEWARAENERERAEDLAGFMLNDLYTGLESLGRLDLLGTVARKSDDYYRGLPSGNVTDAQRAARALTVGRIGEVLTETGSYDAALKTCRESQAMFEALVAVHPENRDWQYQLSVALNRTGDVLQEAGKVDEALESYRRSLAIRRATNDEEHISVCFERVADVLMRKGNREEARKLYRESLTRCRAMYAAKPDDPTVQSSYALALEREGDTSLNTDGLAAALAFYEESLAIRGKLKTAHPANPGYEGEYASCLFRIGHIATRMGNRERAIQIFQESMAVYRRLSIRDPSNASWQRNLALSLHRLGRLSLGGGDRATARKHYTEALAINRGVAERDKSNLRARNDVADSLVDIGQLMKGEGDLKGALKHYNEALAISRVLAEKDAANTDWQEGLGTALFRVGKVHAAAMRPKDARDAYGESLVIMRRLRKVDAANMDWSRSVALTLDALGNLARAQRDLVAAEKHYRESVEIRRELSRIDPDNLREIRNSRASTSRPRWRSCASCRKARSNSGNSP